MNRSIYGLSFHENKLISSWDFNEETTLDEFNPIQNTYSHINVPHQLNYSWRNIMYGC